MRMSRWRILGIAALGVLALCLTALLLLVAIRTRVLMPSLVESLLAPGPWILTVAGALFTVPILLLIAHLEARTIHAVASVSLWSLTKKLFWINLLVSFAGLICDFTHIGIWPSILAVFVLSVLLEWPLLYHARGLFRPAPPGIFLLLSLRMNAASSAVIALLITLASVPVWSHTDPILQREVAGKLQVTSHLDNVTYRLLPGIGVQRDALRIITRSARINPIIVSPDGQLAYNFMADSLTDTVTGVTTPLPLAGHKRWVGTFSPASDLLALPSWYSLDSTSIEILHCRTGALRTVVVPGRMMSKVVWSPNQQYLAYLGISSRWLHNREDRELRVIRLRDGQSATIDTGKWALTNFSNITWR